MKNKDHSNINDASENFNKYEHVYFICKKKTLNN